MSGKAVKLKISKKTSSYISATVSKDKRMFAAGGNLPLETAELVVALYYLANDKDPDVKREAKKSLASIAMDNLIPILSSPQTHPRILDYLSRLHAKNDAVLEVIIQNSLAELITIERIAERANEKLLAIIAEETDLIRKNPEILEAIKKNPIETKKILEKITLNLKDKPDEEVATDEGKGEKPDQISDDKVTATITKKETEIEEEEAHSVYKQILDMGVSQKIKFAITGNKEARAILVKDPNRLVCGNVMKNPRITESEVVLYSASKNVPEEVFRMIEKNRDWLKSYQIKLNLVSNARVPLPIAMKFISHLRIKDMEIISTSRNVPRAIQNMAKQLLVKKREKK